MRGKLDMVKYHIIEGRITPADAGKTNATAYTTAKKTDHPRGCGENWAFFSSLFIFAGSPPRMRGKLR